MFIKETNLKAHYSSCKLPVCAEVFLINTAEDSSHTQSLCLLTTVAKAID